MFRKFTTVECLVVLAIVGLLIAMIVPIVMGVVNYTDTGTISEKRYKAAWTEMRITNYGKHTSTMPVHHPQRWKITIVNGEKYATFNVSEKMYNEMEIGDDFDATELGVSRE